MAPEDDGYVPRIPFVQNARFWRLSKRRNFNRDVFKRVLYEYYKLVERRGVDCLCIYVSVAISLFHEDL